MERKLQVFISSTYSDLLEERQAAVEAILSSRHIPAGMELFTAGDESQLNVIKKWIDESDIYLLILGGRYGSIEPKSGKSYTQLEYEYAVKMKKPYFSIVIKESALDEKVKRFDKSVLELENPQKYNEFFKTVTSKMCSFYEDTKDIKLAIYNKMSEYNDRQDLSGWVSGKDIKSTEDYADEIVRLINENKQLKVKNEAFERRINELVTQSKLNTNRDKKNSKTLQDDDFERRVNRVLKLIGAEKQDVEFNGFISWVEGEKEFELKQLEEGFEYYYTYLTDRKKNKSEESESRNIDYLLIMSIDNHSSLNLEGVLADIRLMMEEQKKVGGTMSYKYVLASKQITEEMEKKYIEFFNMMLTKLKIRNKTHFDLVIWNEKNLSTKEEELGLRLGDMVS